MAKKRLNGEGSIYKRKDGRWVGAYTDPLTKKRGYVYGKSQKEVKERIKEKMEQVVEEEAEETLADWVKYFLYTYKQIELKQSTFGSYLYLYSLHIENSDVGKKKLTEVTANDLQSFYNKKVEEGYNSKTIRHMQILINSALKQAERVGNIKDNPNRHTILPKKQKFEAKILKKEDVVKIIKEGKAEKIYPLVITCVTCGLRKGEILGLKWENIDFEKRQIHITGSLCRIMQEADRDGKRVSTYKVLAPKTKSSIRTIPMMEVTYEALLMQKARQEQDKRKWKGDYENEGFVFARPNGMYMSPREVNNYFHKMLDKYHIERIRFHDLRHTYASIMLEAGVPAKVTQELLGHSTITTTLDIYTHVSEQAKDEAVKQTELIFSA